MPIMRYINFAAVAVHPWFYWRGTGAGYCGLWLCTFIKVKARSYGYALYTDCSFTVCINCKVEG